MLPPNNYLDDLLRRVQGGGNESKLMGLMGLLNQQQGGGMGTGSVTDYSVDPGGDVNVLQPGDPRLVTRFGVTLQQPAMADLLGSVREAGYRPRRVLGTITDSYRSPEQQANAYANKPGLAAPPGSSFHQSGLALDWSWVNNHPDLLNALLEDWNQFNRAKEPWHFSYHVTG